MMRVVWGCVKMGRRCVCVPFRHTPNPRPLVINLEELSCFIGRDDGDGAVACFRGESDIFLYGPVNEVGRV